jgi:hypothetical protein
VGNWRVQTWPNRSARRRQAFRAAIKDTIVTKSRAPWSGTRTAPGILWRIDGRVEHLEPAFYNEQNPDEFVAFSIACV